MNNVSILDCTLRDGGYINNFNFGKKCIKAIIKNLSDASIEIIECGFLKSGEFDPDKTLFGSVEAIREVIGEKNPKSMYVAMIQYGKISPEEISPYDGTSIDGIRLTFHEHEIDASFEVGKKLMNLGYKVFMQPVGTTSYTDQELLNLIERINSLKPFGFYMVDTLGIMYKKDLLRMFYLVDNNLSHRIVLGFHSHNNLQMSFTNAQELIKIHTLRRLVLDASVFGMGRGAGNLNTELIVRYLNKNFYAGYNELKIMEILDDYIRPIRRNFSWGYDAAYYIAAATGCHPNYANFLLNRATLNMQDINNILNSLETEKRHLFDKNYIEEMYSKYLSHNVNDDSVCEKLSDLIGERQVLLLAPGKSILRDEKNICHYIKIYKPYVVSINFIPQNIPVDLIFVSNLKRFANLDMLILKNNFQSEIVVTSNITTENDKIMVVNYSSYTEKVSVISDNAGIMCMNLLRKVGVKNMLLAGFDGFYSNTRENYFADSMTTDVDSERLFAINEATRRKMFELKKQIEINFFSDSLYEIFANSTKLNHSFTSDNTGGGG